MEQNLTAQASYRNQLGSVRRVIEKYESENPLQLMPTSKTEIVVKRDLINRIEKRFQEIQTVTIQNISEEEREAAQTELIDFLEECADLYARASALLAQIEAAMTAPSPGAQENVSLSQLIALMSRQLDEQERQRKTEEMKLKEILNSQKEEFKTYLEESRMDWGNISAGLDGSFAHQSTTKLEPIRVPKFSGSYANWKPFHDLFVSIVDKNIHLSRAQKMHYLKEAVSGEPAQLIEKFSISDDNYQRAWNRLVERYDDKVSITKELMDKFFDLPVTTKPTISSLRKIQADSTAIIDALEALQIRERDPWLIHCVLKKLDRETQWLWAQEEHAITASWEDFDKFMSKRCRALEHCTSDVSSTPAQSNSKSKFGGNVKKASTCAAGAAENCIYCNEGSHRLFRCKKFLSHPASTRLEVVQKLKICQNCLSDFHNIQVCQYPTCQLCKKSHNKLIHDAFPAASAHAVVANPVSDTTVATSSVSRPDGGLITGLGGDIPSTALACSDSSGGVKSNVLFATALISVLDKYGNKQTCRMVLDPASQVNIISSRLCHSLMLPCQLSRFAVDGVNESTQLCRQETQVKVMYQVDDVEMCQSVDCLVMSKVTTDQPNWILDKKSLPIPKHFKLADPQWNVKGRIDLLIGGALAWSYLGVIKHSLGEGLPFLHDSVFGWLIVGPCFKIPPPKPVSCQLTTMVSIDKSVRKFWELEDIPKKVNTTEEHELSEQSFATSCERNQEGRYKVQLPLNDEIVNLKTNRSTAVRQLQYLDRRLGKDPTLKEAYAEIFQEYQKLNIIEPVPAEEMLVPDRQVYYMPHHCVVKENSQTTKVRPVFNASSKASSGISLNDCLHIGPVVQPSLVSILWKFRLHPVALTCDITKMYLQILLHEPHKDLQRFVLKVGDEIKDFRFRTVCFGVASSPFLATRVLNQLADDEGGNFPLAADVIRQNFYVDDCLVSGPSVDQVMAIKQQLKDIFSSAGMSLSKFRSNSAKVVASESQDTSDEMILLDEESKALGIIWHPKSDTFQFRVSKSLIQREVNKLHILSTIARVYDPCGLIGPVIATAKLILQDTWSRELSWQEEVPNDLREQWKNFMEDLPEIEKLRIPRWASDYIDVVKRELHMFCDASMVAYGAVIYLVCTDGNGAKSSHMLASKSRLVPMDSETRTRKLTIPKAELCGALLGVELMNVVAESLQIKDCFYWSDATVVLYQLLSTSPKQEVFVKNRVKKILKGSCNSQWGHVPTNENPADLISRGSTAKKILDNPLWWNGPVWLCRDRSCWPPEFSPRSTEESIQISGCSLQVTLQKTQKRDDENDDDHFCHTLLKNISTFTRMKRTLAWCVRACQLFKKKTQRITRSAIKLTRRPLSTTELQFAEMFLVKWSQKEAFSQIIQAVKNNSIEFNPKLQSIRKLRPFLDVDGVLRVGGRLSNSPEPFDLKFPKIIPKGRLAECIAHKHHLELLHAGPQLVLSSLRLQYWIIDGRNIVRKVIRECVVCKRVKPPSPEQLMGELPCPRVSHIRPFAATGVDFTGSIMIRRAPRGNSLEKAYVVVFVCMSVKAVHLELVTSLSAESFIAVLRRFVARRGIPQEMYSDNGTNFVGADKELARLLQAHTFQEKIENFAAELRIKWNFNPPSAPHQGGLWEAAVRSFKHHFRRVVGETTLTFEDMTTVLAQIEAVLNSRPLVTLTDDVQDPIALTPGHFLIGVPPIQLPDPMVTDITLSRLDHWQYIQRLQQHFAQRWKREYLSNLQSRQKWNKRHADLKIGDVVLFLDDGAAATHWPLGVIEDVHPGRDDVVRVATVRTGKGIYKRPVTKLVKLLRESETNEN